VSNLDPIISPNLAHLEFAPFKPIANVISGRPTARYKQLAKASDRESWTGVWECTSGTFKWYYDYDETLVLIAGEAFITIQSGEERRLSPGDMAYFPAGSCCTWRVESHAKKIATLRKRLPVLLALGARVCRVLRRIFGRRGQSAAVALQQ